MDKAIIIEKVVGTSRLSKLEPLWKSLMKHHAEIAPQLGPTRAPDEAWERRKSFYGEVLQKPDSFTLLAKRDGKPVAYALVHLEKGSVTWKTGYVKGVLETIAMLPEERGKGVGGTLFERALQELNTIGIKDISLEVISTNYDAIRFDERKGMSQFSIIYRGKIDKLLSD